MSKRVVQTVSDDGSVRTRTAGQPRGARPNFDVVLESAPRYQKRAARAVLRFGSNEVTLDGRQLRTLATVIDRHLAEVE